MVNFKSFILIFLTSFFIQTSILIAADSQNSKVDNEEKVLVTKPAKAVKTGDKIYTWIDNRGNRIYSDVPREGAEEMQIQKGTDFDSSAIKVKKLRPMMDALEKNNNTYKRFEIVSPPDDATIRNNQGSFQVALVMTPSLFPGHHTELTIDGKSVSGSGTSIFELKNVDRGSHTIEARIVSKDGKVVVNSQAVVIHMHRGGR